MDTARHNRNKGGAARFEPTSRSKWRFDRDSGPLVFVHGGAHVLDFGRHQFYCFRSMVVSAEPASMETTSMSSFVRSPAWTIQRTSFIPPLPAIGPSMVVLVPDKMDLSSIFKTTRVG